MSHEDNHAAQGIAKIVRMANQIGTFFESKPHDEGVHGVAEHINKFWEPRMRRQLFEMLDDGTQNFNELVVAASVRIKRPITPAEADLKLGLEPSPADVAASQE